VNVQIQESPAGNGRLGISAFELSSQSQLYAESQTFYVYKYVICHLINSHILIIKIL